MAVVAMAGEASSKLSRLNKLEVGINRGQGKKQTHGFQQIERQSGRSNTFSQE